MRMKPGAVAVAVALAVLAGTWIAADAAPKEPDETQPESSRAEEGPVIVLPSTPTVRESPRTDAGTGSGHAIVPAGGPIGSMPLSAATNEKLQTERRLRKLIRRLIRQAS